jgi:ketosteroid isomerase-like protein
MDSRAVVNSFFTYWTVQDVEMALSLASEDVVYMLHISGAALPHGGETRGRDNCRDALYNVLAQFDYLRYEPTIVSADGDVVRAQVHFAYRHRATGEILSGSKRMVFTVKNGQIVRVDGYHDAAMVEAFMRLAAHRAQTIGPSPPPELPRTPPGKREEGH